MNNSKRLLTDLAIVLALSVAGAMLAAGLDAGGTRWLKFIGYMIFFASILSPSILFPNSSCSIMGRLRKRS